MAGGIRYAATGPLSALAILILVVLVILMIPLLFLGIIGAAFTRLGLSWMGALALIVLMFAGSLVNIPLFRIHRDVIQAVPLDAPDFGQVSPFKAGQVWDTIISINFGGAILPVLLAAYLLNQALAAGTQLIVPLMLCAAACIVVTYVSTREISGAGLQVPLLVPALTALLAGLILNGGVPGLAAAVTAFAGGISGILVGGNVAHLLRVRELDVPGVSIGGSGTFGAIVLCCILPALIA